MIGNRLPKKAFTAYQVSITVQDVTEHNSLYTFVEGGLWNDLADKAQPLQRQFMLELRSLITRDDDKPE